MKHDKALQAIQLIRKAVKETADKREESWDAEKGEYKISIGEAAELVCCRLGIYDMFYPIMLLLNTCWNDVLAWTEEQPTFVKTDKEETK